MQEVLPVIPRQADLTTYQKVFLSLGELMIVEQPTCVWTVLGSCVSVILYNPRLRISAICHAQLAEIDTFGAFANGRLPSKYADKAVASDFRYVGSSINYMVDQMQLMGIKKHEIFASVYGGGNVITQFTRKIGDENLTMAFEVLAKHNIRIIKQDAGGNKSRSLRHYSDTGLTLVKVL